MPDLEKPSVSVEACRKCCLRYDFLLPDDKIVTVLCGQPSEVAYKAVSYLWENTKPLSLVCKKCSAVKVIPMRDAGKLWNILEFVRGGSKIWLDALSIDQDDPSDLAAQLAVMGNIYRDAKVVSVMLPAEDKEAYELLKKLAITADEIVKRREEFGLILPALPGTRSVTEGQSTPEELAHEYQRLFSLWELVTSKWSYWSRAWTFQEWTMAAEIDIAWEGIPNHGGLMNVKNVIVSSSSIIGHWKMQNAAAPCQEAESALLVRAAMRSELSKDLNLVRLHFPFQDFLVADEVGDPIELRTRTSLTPMHSISSGTSVEIFEGDPKTPNLRRLLGLALTAISITKRKARYEADLVHCWASMCNIEYEYNKDDFFPFALQKVIAALRKAGIQIFNFHNNCLGGETDLKFMDYAAAMKQSNLASGAFMFGAPVFVGRVDTITHIRHCLEQVEEPVDFPRYGVVNLQILENAIIQTPVAFTDKTLVISMLKDLVAGTADGEEVLNVTDELQKLLENMSLVALEQLGRYSLIPISIGCQDSGLTWDFPAWTIVPSHLDTSRPFIARESLNGTLVLAAPVDEHQARIVAYLNMAHQRHGTYLIKTDENGIADIVFRKPDPVLIEALSSSDFSAGPKPVDPALMAMLGVPGFGLMDALDEARNVQLALGVKRFRAA
ncbi:uncharacterized protein PAC_16360 [Phialocephala subalpina]|uniref:Heterokaryon incompatibility domain-containing protein n=1 Tax=Phialocephala subalpina TaxID=576137 RepID=A0A1L7XN38_9HELO|nr:uncharacterized protein PAC_16360 [Phialocephala subalpina]